MKSKLVIGVVFSVIFLMLVPSISAVEYKTVVDANTSRFITEVKSIDIDTVKQKLVDIEQRIGIFQIIVAIISFAVGWILGTIIYKILNSFLQAFILPTS